MFENHVWWLNPYVITMCWWLNLPIFYWLIWLTHVLKSSISAEVGPWRWRSFIQVAKLKMWDPIDGRCSVVEAEDETLCFFWKKTMFRKTSRCWVDEKSDRFCRAWETKLQIMFLTISSKQTDSKEIAASWGLRFLRVSSVQNPCGPLLVDDWFGGYTVILPNTSGIIIIISSSNWESNDSHSHPRNWLKMISKWLVKSLVMAYLENPMISS